MSDVSKLPPFPDRVPQGGVDLWGTIQWLQRDRDAYRARVEALERELRYVRAHFGDLIAMAARIDALLAACERRSER
jgi:hypothetical protein